MDGHEIKMGQACFDKRLRFCSTVLIPRQEFLHLGFDAFRRWSLEMNFLFPFGTRDNFHRTLPPGPGCDLAHSAAAGREQRCVPAEDSLLGQRRHIFLRRVEHHLDHAFHMAVHRPGSCGFESHAASER